MLKVKAFVFNPFGETTYVVYNPKTHDAVVIDPGMADVAENAEFDHFVSSNSLTVRGVVNTHMHIDHCFGANYVKDKYGVPVSAHTADAFLGTGLDEQSRRFGMRMAVRDVVIDAPLADGDTIAIGDDSLEVIHTPGHSPGGICLYSAAGGFLIAGDTLFSGSIGRTDLPGGDMRQLISSIRTRLLTLPDDTLVLPGHGPTTTIADERRHNPFLAGRG